MANLSEFLGGGGGLVTASTSGAAQTVDFSKNTIHLSTADAATVTYTFSNPAAVAKVDLILEALALSAWDLSAASYDDVSFSVSAQDATPVGLAFKPDGTKLYVVGMGNDRVYQYTLSPAWDLSTASYAGVFLDVSAQDTSPFGITFKPDGTKMFIAGGAGDAIYQYTLSTAWDLSTASYDSVSYFIIQDSSPSDLEFKPDGTKMYMVGNGNDTIYQYTLSTAWDLSTASYDSVSFSVSAQDTTALGLVFTPDGTKMFMAGGTGDAIYQYTLSTAWDLSTASYDSVSFSVSAQDTGLYGLAFKPDGTKLYVIGVGNDMVYQYSSALTPTIVLPEPLEAPSIPLEANSKTAITIATTDGGTSYQVLSVQEGIT